MLTLFLQMASARWSMKTRRHFRKRLRDKPSSHVGTPLILGAFPSCTIDFSTAMAPSSSLRQSNASHLHQNHLHQSLIATHNVKFSNTYSTPSYNFPHPICWFLLMQVSNGSRMFRLILMTRGQGLSCSLSALRSTIEGFNSTSAATSCCASKKTWTLSSLDASCQER